MRPPLPAAGALGLLLAGGLLAGCETPDPGVTVFSGSTSVRSSEPVCWDGGEPVSDAQAACQPADAGSLPGLRVDPGATVGISVDPDVAEEGWVPVLGGRALVPEPLTESYYRFRPSEEQLASGGALQVVAVTSGDPQEVRGVWQFEARRD